MEDQSKYIVAGKEDKNLRSIWMRFKATLEDDKVTLAFACQDYSDKFTFCKDEIDDVIKVLEYLKERMER
jgi:hypothetical protein